MRSAFLLALFVTLVFSDGSNDTIPSDNQPEMFSNWPTPCHRISDPNAFHVFVHRFIIQEHFDMTRPDGWAGFLTRAHRCGAQPHQSFLHKNDLNAIFQVCRGESRRDELNLCVSMRKFRVFVVQSVMRNGRCDVQLQIEHAHVVVACEYIHIVRCIPVHLAGISYTVPSPHFQPCR
ncbi:Zinc metalloproteinase nas-39 [Labeo rohita]|uniref:Zinc metalloproteinase nas-39 n=1 Tax=Labeo rohita TaxID=84645 RepID=A0ABQ8MK48_LABRO|nr:Zinc metalloproteinase nas-39 [Labeo rohita]